MAELVKISDMTTRQIASLCDHTFLKTAEHFDINQAERERTTQAGLRDGAYKDFLKSTRSMKTLPYGLCVYPEDVEYAKIFLSMNGMEQMKISAVAGFPEGYKYSTDEKIYQAEMALDNGADEIDMVLDYDALRRGHHHHVYHDIEGVAKAVHKKNGILKVIFENSAFESNSKLIIKACEMCTVAEAEFIKTSTGFGDYGAKAEDLETMKANFGGGVKMAGGVKPNNVYELLEAVSGRDDGEIELDPMKYRIGESSLISGLKSGVSEEY